MSPELIFLVGALFIIGGFVEKDKAQRVSGFLGGAYILGFGIILIVSGEHPLSIGLLASYAILGVLSWLFYARWSTKRAASESPSEFRKASQRPIMFGVGALMLLLFGVLRHKAGEYLYGVVIFLLFALWDIFNTRRLRNRPEETELPKSVG